MRLFAALVVALGVLAVASSPARSAPLPDSRGTDFWLMFTGNYNLSDANPLTLTLFIAGGTNTSGTVSIPGLGFSALFTVTANVVTSVVLPNQAETQRSGVVENRGIHVTAEDEVTVYGLSRQRATTDAYLALPTDILGKEYFVLGYQNVGVIEGTQFGVVGTEDGTQVTITPGSNSG
jgi:hypothetical protein